MRPQKIKEQPKIALLTSVGSLVRRDRNISGQEQSMWASEDRNFTTAQQGCGRGAKSQYKSECKLGGLRITTANEKQGRAK